jgi:DNA polymerase-3 subunit alpha
MEFLDRVDIKAVGKSVIELLIQTGAFDRFGVPRETLTGNLERAVEHALKKKEDKQLGQSSLFDGTGETEFPDFVFEKFPETSRADKLNIEKKLIGFYFSGHPMDEYKEIWQKAVKVNLGDPENLKTGSCILVGIIKTIKSIITGKGDKMAFATLADYNGEIEVAFFARAWEKCQSHVEADKVAILRGKIEYQEDKDRRSFLADEWVRAQEIDAVIKEEEAQERKWEKFRNTWLYMADLKSGGLGNVKKGSYTIVGFLKSKREKTDKNGNEMAFGTLQDYQGEIDLVFFSKAWAECRDLLAIDEIVALKGSIDPENDRNPRKPGFKVSSIADIAQLTRSASRKAAAGEEPPELPSAKAGDTLKTAPLDANPGGAIHIRLNAGAADNDETLYPLRDYLAGNSGRCPVYIHLQTGAGEKVIRTATGVATEIGPPQALENCAVVAEAWRE